VDWGPLWTLRLEFSPCAALRHHAAPGRATCPRAVRAMRPCDLAASGLKATVASPSSASFGVRSKNAETAPLFARRRPPLLLAAALPHSCRAGLSAHNQATPLLPYSSPNSATQPPGRQTAPPPARPSRGGHPEVVPPPAPDDTAPGPTSTPNRPVQVHNSFQACSPADSGTESPPASSSSPARTTLR
jgi:hypothetical protein